MTDRGDVRQAWRFVGAGFVLVAIGMFGLLAGLRFAGSTQDGNVAALRAEIAANHARIVSNQAVIASNVARIRQLEDDYRQRNIPIPAPPSTTTTVRRRTAPRSMSTSTSTTSTTRPAPTTTTTTTRPCRAHVARVCVP